MALTLRYRRAAYAAPVRPRAFGRLAATPRTTCPAAESNPARPLRPVGPSFRPGFSAEQDFVQGDSEDMG